MLVWCVLQKKLSAQYSSVSPGRWRTASLSESQLDAASLEFYPDKHKSVRISNCVSHGCRHCSAKPLRNIRIHVHFSADKGLVYNKTSLTIQETSVYSAAEKKNQDSEYFIVLSDCNTNTPVILFLLAPSTVFSNGDRQVKYDKPMAWSLSPRVPSDDKCSSELLLRRRHDNGQSKGFQALSQYHSSLQWFSTQFVSIFYSIGQDSRSGCPSLHLIHGVKLFLR